ncbi:PilZ domain-containing protein [Desulfacinum hydrothermale DSM 13146]|uniref:PilZ domain-containing protein n=1 Tax=Desulfacinum hydrothermale DSM 13146 TaxID=1121390 RepID=A0A1W1XS07_9BACT|nr:PilZ domain-containing protein [Desulfacinum hydrothermale]SMC26760.1 PilZ domain-containing protein [Desulfacinum hydrothermale DSM 13146]
MDRGERDRRRQRRFPLKEGVFAAIRPDFLRVGRVVDAGRGGVGLAYASDLGPLEANTVTVDLFTDDTDRMIPKVRCRVVYDRGESPLSQRNIRCRRIGLQFLDLPDHQLRFVHEFLESHRA